MRSSSSWVARPDWYFQSVSGGLGPLGVHRGFEELFEMGLIDRVPALAVIQAEGCSPMVQAFKAGRDVADPITPETRIAILSTGDPGKAPTLARFSTGGTGERQRREAGRRCRRWRTGLAVDRPRQRPLPGLKNGGRGDKAR
jgi:threonine synthase